MSTNSSNIEYMFSSEYQKYLKEQKAITEHLILSHILPQEEYVYNVGLLKAFNECELKFNTLLKAYFNN